jgi:deazaflavin-dependent oxidoreductase (nitroreductase family)
MRRLPLVPFALLVVVVKVAAWAVILRYLARDDPDDADTRRLGIERPHLRRFVNRWLNPVVLVMGLSGGRRSPWATLIHTGRRSGVAHETPVMPYRIGDSLYIPLTYGPGTDWCRNTLAAGRARVRWHAQELAVTRPAVLPVAEVLPLLPGGVAAALRMGNAHSILRLGVVA